MQNSRYMFLSQVIVNVLSDAISGIFITINHVCDELDPIIRPELYVSRFT